MAFYQDTKNKSRKEKREVAQSRGGFEDEGSRYGGEGYRGKPQQSRGYGRPAGRPGYERSEDRQGRPGYGRPAGRPAQGRPAGHPGDRPARPGYDRPEERPYRPAQGRPAGRPGDRPARPSYDRPEDRSGYRPAQGRPTGRPVSFRDRPRATPVGERPAPERLDPREFKKSGNYRYSQGEFSHYSDRGAGRTPPSYDDQRRAQQAGEPRYNQSRYSAPVAYDRPYESPEEAELVPNENLLSGRNPIREALKSGRDIEKLMVARGELSGSAREIVQMAKERHIPVQEVDRARLDAITHNHQGMLAFASAYQYSTLEKMLELAEERQEDPFLILLDGITDPHNLGAIIRTAECAGAHGVIVQERRAVGLTPAAVKASAGAVEHLPVARVTNLGNTIQQLKEQNIWVYAADMEGEDYGTADFKGPVALVIGAEGEGVGRRVLECCDKSVSIPLKGQLDSLNASVAAGILMYAVMRTR